MYCSIVKQCHDLVFFKCVHEDCQFYFYMFLRDVEDFEIPAIVETITRRSSELFSEEVKKISLPRYLCDALWIAIDKTTKALRDQFHEIEYISSITTSLFPFNDPYPFMDSLCMFNSLRRALRKMHEVAATYIEHKTKYFEGLDMVHSTSLVIDDKYAIIGNHSTTRFDITLVNGEIYRWKAIWLAEVGFRNMSEWYRIEDIIRKALSGERASIEQALEELENYLKKVGE